MNTTKPIPHGTLSGRKHHKCTCQPCIEAARTYARRVHRQRGYGTWQPFVDAEPVREHVLTLIETGINLKRVGELAGVTHSVVERLIYEVAGRPRTARLRPEIAEKLLTVPAIPAPNHRIDALGTRRRVQTLVAAGWPTQYLAPHFGLHPRHANELLRAELVLLRTAQAVAEAYTRLADTDPVTAGVPDWIALRSRRHAERRGWLPPTRWTDDDFDAPEPTAADKARDAIEQALAGKPAELTREQQLTVTELMTRRGDSTAAIAAVIRRSDRTVTRWRTANGWKPAA